MGRVPRREPRRATNATGLAKFDGKEVPVVLRDCSVGGARLRPLGSVPLPDSFKLTVPMEKIDVTCEVLWRRGSYCGVRFKI
jgi:hypothetical protein